MKYRELSIIVEVLLRLKPKRCLEWGAGWSTLFFPNYLQGDYEWISIEHDRKWYKHIMQHNRNPRVKLIHIPPNNYPWSDPFGDGSYEDLKDYIERPSKLGKFDFILIDGRARVHCLKKALHMLNTGGVVVLHDANREYYHTAFKFYPHQILFRDYRTGAGGIWIGSRDLELSKILNVTKHLKSWFYISKIGRVVRI